MKRISKRLIIPTLIFALVFPILTSAYSKSYSFDIAHEIKGTTIFSLSNKATSTSVRGDTYWANGNVKSTKSDYKVTLYKSILKQYKTDNIKADGKLVSKSFGTVSKNDYKVYVTKATAGDYGDRVKGSGTIDQ